MAGINKIILVGHLGKDPELRYLNNVAVVSFPLATTELLIKNGLKTEQTEWHNIVMWRTLAEAAKKILTKGKLVYLEGKCRSRCFEDKNGNTKYTTEIVAETFSALGMVGDVEKESIAEGKVKRKRLQ